MGGGAMSGESARYGAPFELPLEALSHVETYTRPAWVVHLRRHWDAAKAEPIDIVRGDSGRWVVIDGHHRLRIARARGDATILAVRRRGFSG